MNNKRVFAVLSLALFFTGCAAEMMETHGDKIVLLKLPGSPTGKGGVVRYLNGGMSSWAARRRANAEKQMRDFCQGEYVIVEEGPRSKFGSSMPIGKSVSLEVDQYTYIRFQCPTSSRS